MAKLTRAARLERRLVSLEAITTDRAKGYDKALNSLKELWTRGRQPARILVRVPLMETTTGAPPPVSQLVNGRSHALRVALIALMAAQCKKGPAPHVLDLGLTSKDHNEVGWDDLIVSASVAGDGSSSRPVDQKHAASARHALRRLSDPAISLVQLPDPLPAKGGYDNVHLFEDSGPRALGHPVPYTVPDVGDDVVAVPIQFFLNGWVYVLEDAEIATYLMYRRLCAHFHPGPAHVSAAVRKGVYGITQAAWEMHWVLEESGILLVEADERRRADGTFDGHSAGAVPRRHRFTLHDPGLEADALPVLWHVIDERMGAG
jgi:hypothetical protein